MADQKTNIDAELNTIKDATKGEDVRAAIISAIKKIYDTREYYPTTKKFTHNTDVDGVTGGPWNRVIVQVEGAASVNVDDMSSHPITVNDYYDIPKLKEMGFIENPNCIGIDGFTVNVPQTPGNFGVINITENGTYDPLLDGYDGYSKVYVNVLGGERKDYYTVKFFDGKNFLAGVSVPYGANATYPNDKALPDSGGLFTGWNPNPVSVNRDMNCYAVYAGQGATGAGSLVETIPDTWKTINTNMKAGNRKYELGSTKLLRLTGYNGVSYILNMMLVAYNLDITANNKYANSTWININKDGITMQNATNHVLSPGISVLSGRVPEIVATIGTTFWWGNSLVRALYNRDSSSIIYRNNPGNDDLTYYNVMLSQGLTLPDVINDAAGFDLFGQMLSVKKYSAWNQITPISGTSSYNQYKLVDQPTTDKIWLPNYRELLTPYPTGAPSGVAQAKGNAGPTYGNPSVFSKTHVALEYGSNTHWIMRDTNPAIISVSSTAWSFNITSWAQNYGEMFYANSGAANATGNPLPIGFCL